VPELLRHMGEHGHYAAFREMTDAYFDAFKGGNNSAIGSMIDFYGGAGTFAGWPQKVRDYAIATTAVNLLDWICGYSFHLTRGCLAKVGVPTLVMCGGASHPAMQRATELLSQCLASGSLEMVEGAAHFMISTHAEAVATKIAGHIAAVGAITLENSAYSRCDPRDPAKRL
jgi:pimeloyl-ACP methyl ester carboxylesterase